MQSVSNDNFVLIKKDFLAFTILNREPGHILEVTYTNGRVL